jgi:hypothetical protein
MSPKYPEQISCSVAPGTPSTFWKGANSNRYYNQKKRAGRDSGTEKYYLQKRSFNSHAATIAFVTLVVIFIAYQYLK